MQAALGGARDVARVVVDENGRGGRDAEYPHGVVEEGRIALALAESVAVEDPIELPIKRLSRIQPLQPVRLIAQDGRNDAQRP